MSLDQLQQQIKPEDFASADEYAAAALAAVPESLRRPPGEIPLSDDDLLSMFRDDFWAEMDHESGETAQQNIDVTMEALPMPPRDKLS